MLNTENILKDLVKLFKEIGLAEEFRKYLNIAIPKYCFNLAMDNGKSIDDFTKDMEDSSTQWTVFQTVRLSYEGVKSFFTYNANEFLKSKTNGNVKILTVKDLVDRGINVDSVSFDLVVEFYGEIIMLEMKVTQSKGGWQGSTHSTSKVPNYFLILLDIDKEKVVNIGEEYVKGIFMMIDTFGESNWKGEASNSNSRTGLSLITERDFSDAIICGELNTNDKRKYYEIIVD